MSAECLTQNLNLELEKTNQQFSRWCDDKVDLLNANTTTYHQLYEEMECTLRALQDNENQLELARTSNDKTKQEQSPWQRQTITKALRHRRNFCLVLSCLVLFDRVLYCPVLCFFVALAPSFPCPFFSFF